LPGIHGDRVPLQQVLLNLILNAVEAMGSVEVGPRELLIGTEQDHTGVLVAVRDSGPGIDPEYFERVSRLSTPVCTENPIRVDDVMESSLMSVVNGRGNKLFSPRGDPTGFASRPKVCTGPAMRFQTTVDLSLIRGLVTRIDRCSSGGFPMSKRGRR